MSFVHKGWFAHLNEMTERKLSIEDAPTQSPPAHALSANTRPAQTSGHANYSDLPRELQDKIIKLLITARPSPKVDLLPGKLAIFAEDVRIAVTNFCTANDGVLLTQEPTLINEFREIGADLFRGIQHDIESFTMLNEQCGCDGAIMAANVGLPTGHLPFDCAAERGRRMWYKPIEIKDPEVELRLEYELTPQGLRRICEQTVSNALLVLRLTGIDYVHPGYHSMVDQKELAIWHGQHGHGHGLGPCGVFMWHDPTKFCSKQCFEVGPWDDYTPEEIKMHFIETKGKPVIVNWR